MTHKEYLISLAERYETREFIIGDPSWFMHQVSEPTEQELLAFIAASLSYGSRKQFLPKIQLIMDASKGNLKEWLLAGAYNEIIDNSQDCFYRLYSMRTFNNFLNALTIIIRKYGSLRAFVEALRGDKEKLDAIDVITAFTKWFSDHDSQGVIPKNTNSSCKRLCLFLRWMVRKGSPVDLGLWNDLVRTSSLIIPMDVHIVQESVKLGLISSTSTSMSNAKTLTAKLAEIWPEDPTKGDFALFGLGVDTTIM